MNIVPAAKLPLNHYLTETPQRNFCNLKCKALALNVLSKISWVAIIAIMATVFTITYGTIAVTGSASLLLAGLVISTPFLVFGIKTFSTWSDHFAKRAEVEGHVAVHLDELEKKPEWKTPQKIEQFLREQGLDPQRIPLEALQQVNRAEPLCALLPLIARFNYLKESGEADEKISRDIANETEEGFRKREAELGKPIGEPIKQEIRFQARTVAWMRHGHGAIPAALNAAVILQIIQQPTDRQLDIHQPNEDLSLPRIGKIAAKSFEDWMFNRIFPPLNDNYLVFHEKLHRPPLTLTEIEENMDPRALRLKLFPNEIRA